MHEAVHDKLVEEHRTLEPQGGDLQAIAGRPMPEIASLAPAEEAPDPPPLCASATDVLSTSTVKTVASL